MKSVETYLLELSPRELMHKREHSVMRFPYKKMMPLVYFENEEPVYLFTFDQFISQPENKLIFLSDLSHKEHSSLLITQHTRYSTVPLHVHDFIEINYVLSGQITERINNETYQLHAGDACFLDTNTTHTILNTDKDDIIINFLIKKSYFTTAFLKQLTVHSSLSKFIFDSISSQEFHNRFLLVHGTNLKEPVLAMIQEQMNQGFEHGQVISAYLLIFFILLMRENHYSISEGASTINDIVVYMNEHFRDITLEGLATHFSFHPNYLSSYIRKNTNKTFKTIIQEKRLEVASLYLKETKWPISKIINEVGYSNQNFFYQKFRQIFGCSPKQYREKFYL